MHASGYVYRVNNPRAGCEPGDWLHGGSVGWEASCPPTQKCHRAPIRRYGSFAAYHHLGAGQDAAHLALGGLEWPSGATLGLKPSGWRPRAIQPTAG